MKGADVRARACVACVKRARRGHQVCGCTTSVRVVARSCWVGCDDFDTERPQRADEGRHHVLHSLGNTTARRKHGAFFVRKTFYPAAFPAAPVACSKRTHNATRGSSGIRSTFVNCSSYPPWPWVVCMYVCTRVEERCGLKRDTQTKQESGRKEKKRRRTRTRSRRGDPMPGCRSA